MSRVNVMMSPPDAMRRDMDRKGLEWWSRGGEYESFADAIDNAKDMADEMNFPVQLKCMGQKMTVYPRKLRERGYS